jgi:uncharacterized protein (DUF1330 family)
MSVYLIFDEEVTDPEGFQEYIQLAGPVLTHYGGKVLAAGGTSETLEGDWHPNELAILEFASVEQALRWYHSDEYAPVKNIRLKTAHTRLVLVRGIHHLQRSV